MFFSVCSLCGKRLNGPSKYLIVKDEADKYEKFHSVRWNICDNCHQDLVDKNKKVRERLENEGKYDDGEVSVLEFF